MTQRAERGYSSPGRLPTTSTRSSFSRRPRTLSLKTPHLKRLFTSVLCISRLKSWRKRTKSLLCALSRRILRISSIS